jgi:hypothetical protein
MLVLLTIPLFATGLHGRIIRVPADAATIQAGILASADGDTVAVAPGTYIENIRFFGREVLVRSEGGPEVTTIDGGSPQDPDSASCVMFVGGEGRGAILDGFTLTHGGGVSLGDWGFYGGGVFSDGASPTIRNNVITANMTSPPRSPGDTSGGGIHCQYGSPRIERNLIVRNDVSYTGGGIGLSFCSAEVVNNTIVENGAGHGGGISFWRYSSSVIRNNIVAGNGTGGGIYCGAEVPDLRYNDFWDNAPVNYDGCNPGIGDISADPLFVGGDPFDYHLRFTSPCIDAGDPTDPLDPDSTRADIGAYPFDQTTLGPLALEVTPDRDTYLRGESLGFTATVRNNTDSLIVFEAWTRFETPWGQGHSPALGPVDMILGPREAISPHIDRQQIPDNAPFGAPYVYEVLLGTYPGPVIARDSFEFAIVPPTPSLSGGSRP